LNSNKYQRVFTSEEGIQVLDELIATFHVQFIFDKDSATQTAFNCGQKDVIDFILARIKDAE
jgi:hypothetical protein